MLPDPLHPAVVHFPIVLMFLLPLAALGAIWHMRKSPERRGAWVLTTALAGALTLSAWVAVETGERDEEGVERVVPEAPLETHEEAAERFLLLSAGVLVIAGAGLLRGRIGAAARLATTAAAFGLVVAGAAVGHSGGELVYRHGAAAAHAAAGRGAPEVAGETEQASVDAESDDD
ncbi:MAG TPA: DUF2231 domain-containing protein [Gemmatimonadales bacterium]|nr:DUF2231 domain-containing protein [Gemmatimonadales bacterium]